MKILTPLERWTLEYTTKEPVFPSTLRTAPSRALMQFLERHEIPENSSVLDVFCGGGRNALELARRSYDVFCLDFCRRALEIASQRAQESGAGHNIRFLEHDLSKSSHPLALFTQNKFDLVIDFMGMHLLDATTRHNYGREIARVLKPGGMFLFYTVSRDGADMGQLLQTSPAQEPGSYVVQANGIIEHAFNIAEILGMFPQLHVNTILEIPDRIPMAEKVLDLSFYSSVLVKDSE